MKLYNKRLNSKPKFNLGDDIVFKSGKQGKHYGLENGMKFTVEDLVEPMKPSDKSHIVIKSSPWNGWQVKIGTGLIYPASWFKNG